MADRAKIREWIESKKQNSSQMPHNSSNADDAYPIEQNSIQIPANKPEAASSSKQLLASPESNILSSSQSQRASASTDDVSQSVFHSPPSHVPAAHSGSNTSEFDAKHLTAASVSTNNVDDRSGFVSFTQGSNGSSPQPPHESASSSQDDSLHLKHTESNFTQGPNGSSPQPPHEFASSSHDDSLHLKQTESKAPSSPGQLASSGEGVSKPKVSNMNLTYSLLHLSSHNNALLRH